MKIKNMFILGALVCTTSAVLADSAPVIITQPKSQTVSEGRSVTFSVSVEEQTVNNSSYPSGEYPGCIVDQNPGTKYLNFQGMASGFVVVPTYGETTLRSFQITTGNDMEGRDPTSYQIFGTHDKITRNDLAAMDNSDGSQNNWILIAEGTLTLPSERLTMGDIVPVYNDTLYSAYKVIFPTLKDNSVYMQVADIQFYEVENPVSDIDFGFLSSADMDYTVAVVSLTDPLTYQWYKNGFKISGATNSQYQINKVSQSDVGQYFVIVSNDIDSVTSNLATLTVYEGTQGITVTCYQSDMDIESIDDAEACIANPSQWIAEPIVEVYDVINFSDSGIGTHFENPVLFPCQSEVGKDNENFVMLIETQINIPEAGYWSFGVLSDDGFKLNITGNGVDFYSEYSGTRAAEDTVTSFNFPSAGIYQIRLLYFEATADAELEFYAIKGQYNSFNGNCRLIGDVANGGLPVGNL